MPRRPSQRPLVAAVAGVVVVVVVVLVLVVRGLGDSSDPTAGAVAPGPSVASPSECADSTVTVDAPDERACAVATTLAGYFDGVNTGDDEAVLAAFTDDSPRRPDARARAGLRGVHDDLVHLTASTDSADGVDAVVTFRSVQPAGKGPAGARSQTCTLWTIEYQMREVAGVFLIADLDADHEACP